MTSFLRRLLSLRSSSPEPKPAPHAAPPLPDRPTAGDAERTALAGAVAWLGAATLRDARALALGEERTFEVGQSEGRLTLCHADGARLDLSAQLLGTFSPHDRSFRWAWANPAVAAGVASAATAARDDAATAAFAAFRIPTFAARFDDALALAALAGRLGGCHGVYRCLTADHLTVFVGYAAPDAAAGDRLRTGAAGSPEDEAEALALVDRYAAEMLAVDVTFSRETEGLPEDELDRVVGGVMDRLLPEKNRVYDGYWSRDDDTWRPGSFGSPSEHDPARWVRSFTLPRRAGGVYVVRQKQGFAGYDAYVVQRPGGAPRITDIDLDWGAGVLLAPGA